MQQPKMILADEPIASLDPINAKVVMDSLQDINLREGITVITNLHTLDTARAYCNRIIGMAAGKVVFDGAPEELTREAVRMVYGAEADGAEISEAITSTSIRGESPRKIAASRARSRPSPTPEAAIASPASAASTKTPSATGRTAGSQQERRTCSEKHFYGAVSLVASRSARHRRKTSRNSASASSAARTKPTACATSSASSTSCLPCSASRRSRYSRPPIMTARSRACSAARSTMPNSALPATPRSISRTRRPCEPILTTVQTDGSTGYYSIMVARKDSGIKTLADIKGKKLGFADPDSTSGYLVPASPRCRRISAASPVKEYFGETGFGGGHENLVLEVLKGTFDAGTTFGSGVGEFKDGYTSGNLAKMVEKGVLDMDDLVEMWKSPLIPNGPIVVRSSMDDGHEGQVQAVHGRPAEVRPGMLLGHPGRRFHRLHRSDAGILPADHRRPQSADRQRKLSGNRTRRGNPAARFALQESP